MKKLKLLSVLLLMVSTAAFFGFRVFKATAVDKTPPVVTCESESITVPVDVTEEELVKGVKAEDKRDGDVSGSLLIEKMSDFVADGTRVVTYAAVDKSMNVGRTEQTITYEGYKKPEFELSQALCFAQGTSVNLLDYISAESVLDGDLTENIKYNLESTINVMSPGTYPVEFRVMDSAGKTVYLNVDVEICEAEYRGINVTLSDYLVYLKKGASFDPEKYYEGADRDGTLDIKSNVKTKKSGTYYVDYIVEGTAVKGKSRLVVVVE